MHIFLCTQIWLHLFKKKTLFKESVNSVPHHYGQFALSLGKESPCVFSKLTCLIQTPRYYGHYLKPPQCPYWEGLTVNVSKKNEQYPHTNSPNWSLYISFMDGLREFDKRWKHCLLGDHFVNSHNLISWHCMDIVRRKLMLVTIGT